MSLLLRSICPRLALHSAVIIAAVASFFAHSSAQPFDRDLHDLTWTSAASAALDDIHSLQVRLRRNSPHVLARTPSVTLRLQFNSACETASFVVGPSYHQRPFASGAPPQLLPRFYVTFGYVQAGALASCCMPCLLHPTRYFCNTSSGTPRVWRSPSAAAACTAPPPLPPFPHLGC